MDSTDEQILKALRQNARTPYIEIAKNIGASEGMVRARVNRMLSEGSIKAFTVKVAAGNIKALIDVKIGMNVDTSNVASRIMKMKGVDVVYEVSGEEDIVAIVDVMSTLELNSIVEEIRRLENVASTKTRLIMREHWR
ncbi:MAG: Lrp/AsnC family transcriptional regulator [Candidatus Thermoplasmatota archaeon]|nr:Lrp/AsnC family transcriptional regulator [Candidatus Thermoplasmatota archaeon]